METKNAGKGGANVTQGVDNKGQVPGETREVKQPDRENVKQPQPLSPGVPTPQPGGPPQPGQEEVAF